MIEDWHCLDLARRGDETAWRILFHRHYASLVRMTLCLTGSLDAAHDAAQESFVRLLRVSIPHRGGSFRSYLSTIAYHLALKERKRHALHTGVNAVEIVDDSPSPLDNAIADETDRIVFRAIQSLGIEQREILVLRFFGGHSYEDIARIVNLPVGTVKSRIFYAVRNCRERLRNEGAIV
jgi:RNA polymerase sigma-70 factor (ECF subfamily)